MSEPPSIFTLEAVNALVPRLRAIMQAQMERRTHIERSLDRLAELLGRAPEDIQIDARDPASVRDLKRDLAARIAAYRSGWREVEKLGAVLKDARMGLVDFQGRVDGKLVWLCWRYGEDAVTHYHALDEGFAARKPIEAAMRLRHLN